MTPIRHLSTIVEASPRVPPPADGAPPMAIDVKRDPATIERELIALLRTLHANPEIAFEEHETARLIFDRLAALNLAPRIAFNTGVVGVLRGGRPGRTIMYRADIDALPIHEANDVSYRSTRDG